MAEFFEFGPGWYREALVLPLISEYYVLLRSTLRAKPHLRKCLCRCRHCRIFFLAHPRKAGRRDLGCPLEVGAILSLLRVSNDKTLSILEQARFLAEWKQVRGMSLSEIAESLSRSKAWVSMRLSLLAEMSEPVREKLFSGAFHQTLRKLHDRSGQA